MNAMMIHKWEAAGLGQAPYRLIGVSREVFQAVPGDPNCPMQPGSTCDYCGQGIMYVCQIASADGKQFKVGCDCVRRVSEGETILADEAERRVKGEQARARKQSTLSKYQAAVAQFKAHRDAIATFPHPKAWEGQTLADQVEWMIRNAGNSRAMVEIKKALKTAGVS